MEKKEKIKKILSAIKIEVDNIDKFEKDIDSILGMFDELKDINVDEYEANLNKKKIKIDQLREDEPYNWNFRPDMRGKYFKVPNVSKK